MIRTEGLSKRFGDLVAVADLDLEIAPGEVFGLLGPNGAGKTTTVRLLTGLIAASEGRAWIDGHDIREEVHRVRALVGILTETPGLYRRLTARENLRVFGGLHDVPDLDGQIERYLRLLELWDRRDDRAGGFSKGMRQKLAIARALLHEPRVLFLDEPTAALDPAAARVVREFIASLRQEGRTIVLCTHNLDEAERLCDRIAIFNQRLLQLGTPAGLRHSAGRAAVTVTLAGEATPELVDAARAVTGVDGVEAEGATLRVPSATPEALAPELVRALVGAGAAIVGVAPERPTLEQVYLDLVGANDGAREEAP